MKAVILAGGRGSRISEETSLKPKPMVEIGGRPILWHIMKIYAAHGVKDFIVCLGYQGYVIKEYFANFHLHSSDVSFDLKTGTARYSESTTEDWTVTLVDTGLSTETGGRVRRLRQYLEKEEAFCLTYGDGVGNIDITKLIAAHRAHGKLATMTVVHPPGRFGIVDLVGDSAATFREKPDSEFGYINGGFFVLNPRVLDLIPSDDTVWERDPLESLSRDGELVAFRHEGFWQPMDTLREKDQLEAAWRTGKAPWKTWS
ncbi:glucose-1-phosphate cytidylyltransferase [Rhizomicrobium electricum]|uniref:Glucose-1-phosphate cytidylyltransferase n=1 Tax=Rhizomicrobium electricum TaxID=480070 RepID=A0ABN1E7Y3_9PROT|nr:glucose-1-phosphate cytidylyltransferase [Rhizomicrobium electricum]NIJ47894.1 glucose-1-phosphate cytidylyltransferase [Rhizomicrobium electricum]